MAIQFGTDGWRGIISDDYTFSNVRLVAAAIADYVLDRKEAQKGLVIGYDARFLSRQYAETCAAVVQSMGVKVWLSDRILPTPALTWQVRDRSAAGGIVITASHNPPEYNGLKFKASFGGSASPEMMAALQKYVDQREAAGIPVPQPAPGAAVELFSPQAAYLDHVRAMLDANVLKTMRGKIVFDCMHGSGMGYCAELAKTYGLDLVELRGTVNPSFGGISPEPIMKNLGALREFVLAEKPRVALATDGDADRIGALDEQGRFINAHQIMALLIKYLVEKRGWSGGVVQTLTVSELVRRVAGKYGLKLYEMPVGFKHVTQLMLSEDILIGGEEAGGIGLKNYIPERDGILLGFLLIEVVAAYGKTLGALLAEMMAELGYFYYDRIDLHLSPEQKERLVAALATTPPVELDGLKVLSVKQGDGCKLTLPDGWVIFRASGTEPIVRIYSEANDQELLKEILRKAEHYAKQA
ncbi:MAG: phosphoglucomutase/phosphomannomutase alpha/beta/alpha domain [Firmicutes bacterium]|nr:phosphoglucomutase/phosphomannomutase alpha/beta/alpha domain [Bacillota bacterium]